MTEQKRTILLCSCDDTMSLDADAVRRGCHGARLETGHQFCRAELERARGLLSEASAITVACTQEAPLFSEIAAEGGAAEGSSTEGGSTEGGSTVTFANVRETAGWSREGDKAGPKMAALLAAAAEPMPDTALASLTSDGVILIYGRDEQAIEAARLLENRLDVTVLLTKAGDIAPGRVTTFPIVAGTIRAAKGHLGAFDLMVDDFAQALPPRATS